MNFITFFLVYVLVGVVVFSITHWGEILDLFDHFDNKELQKGELQEFFLLMTVVVLGWGFLFIYMFMIDPIKTLKERWQKKHNSQNV